MRRISGLLQFLGMMMVGSFICFKAMADWTPSPYSGGDLTKRLQNKAKDGLKHVSRQCVDFAGKASGASGTLPGGVIPADAVVTNSYYVVTQAFDSSATARLNFGCDSASDLFSALDLDGDATGTVAAGAVDGGAASSFVYIDASCNIDWSFSGANSAVTEGKICIFNEWIMAE
jgi:hypothetical protein